MFHKGNCDYCKVILEGHICDNPKGYHFCSKEHENKFFREKSLKLTELIISKGQV